MKIAIVGKMRSGKDTLADYFVENSGAVQLAFGDEIKSVAKKYFPKIVEQGKPRKLYQTIGQEFRKFDRDVWVNALVERIDFLSDIDVKDFVVSDVRQMNEYLYLKQMGFTVIKVEAHDEIRKERILAKGDTFNEEDFFHETEVAVDDIPYDYLISNNTTLMDFYDQIYYVYDELKGEETP